MGHATKYGATSGLHDGIDTTMNQHDGVIIKATIVFVGTWALKGVVVGEENGVFIV
jgi:hypothetical protein